MKGGENMKMALGILIGIPVGFGIATLCAVFDIF